MTRQEAMDYYGSIMDRIHAWERNESTRLREQILVPVFAGNRCILHNSMVAWEQGRPWKEMPKNYYKLGKFYNWKQEQIWKTHRRLTKHFYDRYIAACRQAA